MKGMNEVLEEIVLFLKLAQAFKARLQLSDRDRALVIAASCAANYQMDAVAEFCRQLILQNNRGHMLRKWATMHEALKDDDFLHFLRQVKRRLPVERAETLLVEFGYRCDVQLSDYANETAFVAAVMGVDGDWLVENFAP
jgi:hypothetical protein